MIMIKYIIKYVGVFLLATMVGAFGLELARKMGVPGVHGLLSVAGAQVLINRPMTPVNVAGVARTTARRCAGWDPYGMRCDSGN
jgi:hypothetical protein